MPPSVREPVTVWLARWRAGQKDALEHIVPLVYEELRRVARRQLSQRRAPQPLSATTLVHEAYLRLLDQRQMAASDRAEFLAIAGHLMRRILVDEARRRTALKRGGTASPVPIDLELEPGSLLNDADLDQVLAIDALLDRLAALDDRAARIVEYRVFAGLTLDETAAALDVSVKTVQRTWSTARAWLRKELGPGQRAV
jgi:RNA polymerase sigma factor (TIGR02999 family)